jgi:triphosphatase
VKNNIELTLSFRPQDLGRIEKLQKIEELATGDAVSLHVDGIYFDTPDRRLRGRKTFLRVATSGSQRLQAVMSAGSPLGGSLGGADWEGPVPSEEPVLSALEDAGFGAVIEDIPTDALEPVFRTEITRTSRRLALADGAEVSMDLDVGEIVTVAAQEPIHDMTLRLNAGAPKLLFDLALDLCSQAPLTLTTESAAARGFRVAGGEPPPWSKDPGVNLSGRATVEEAIIHTVSHCLDHLLANQTGLLESDHPEGVHQVRVALRRLRSALRLFRSILPADQYEWLVGEVRWLTGQLGPARDWDVFDDEIVGPVADALSDEAAFTVFRRRIGEEREVSRKAARQSMRDDRYARLLLQVGGWLQDRPWRDQRVTEESVKLFAPVIGLSDSLLAKRHKAVFKRARKFAKLSVPERHQLRIDVKKLRYACDFFASLYARDRVKAYAARLAKLQDALGYLNDVAVANLLVERIAVGCKGNDALQCRHAGGIVVGWHTHTLVRSEKKMRADVAEFVDSKPFWSTS